MKYQSKLLKKYTFSLTLMFMLLISCSTQKNKTIFIEAYIVGENYHYNDNGFVNTPYGRASIAYKSYYKNGQIAEQQNYKSGKLEGESIWYSENAVVLKHFIYTNDELHGVSKYYNPKAELITEGRYKNGKKHDRFSDMMNLIYLLPTRIFFSIFIKLAN